MRGRGVGFRRWAALGMGRPPRVLVVPVPVPVPVSVPLAR
ncbi:hypothetical protein SLNHY_6730 [Streptomyces albus]|nr:hypothetical protein SLNHY_6730 [Streptomyces albus]